MLCDPMRVGFMGASGTGKTTLAQWMVRTFGLKMNPVGSRSVALKMGFDNPYDVDRTGQRQAFQLELLRSKVAWEREQESFVTDRTTLDNLVYFMMHAPEECDDDFHQAVFAAMNRYTHVIYCPVLVFINLDNDGARVADPMYHRLFDSVLLGYMRKMRATNPSVPAPITMCSADLEARQRQLGGWFRFANPG